jgi:hypothetical protein
MEANSGIIRTTFDGNAYELEAGGVFGSDKWHSHYCVMTNVGLFKFNQKDLLLEPVLHGIKTLNLVSMKGQKRAGRDNLFEIQTTDEKGKLVQTVFSIDDPQSYTKWEKKIKEMISERKTKK